MDHQNQAPGGNPYGNSNGNPYGNSNGSPYGNPNGGPYGNPNGNPYGNPNGSPYGNPYGNPNGNPYNNPYGNPNGGPYGAPYPMPGYPLSNANLKWIAKRSLAGHLAPMIGITLLLFLFSMVISYLFGFIGNQLFLMCATLFETDSAILRYGIAFLLNFIASLISCLFTVGSANAFIQLLYGQPVHVSMLFHSFKHHPDRVMLTNLPLILISLVLSIPATIYEDYLSVVQDLGPNITLELLPAMPSTMALVALVSLAASVLLLFITLHFAMIDYLLAEMEDTPKNILRTALFMMKGHKARYFGLILSFLGWFFLGIFTCGIGLLWVVPYQQATSATFYLDLKRVHQQRNGQQYGA